MPWPSLRAFLLDRLAGSASVDAMLAGGEFVDDRGRPWTGEEPYRANTFIWFHRPLGEELEVPFPIDVLHRDDRIVVVDKPHFLATMPRGRHITQTVVVRMRQQLDLPELSPAHRLDRLTAGVLVLTTERRWRSVYQQLFEARQVTKTYEAIAGWRPLDFPCTVHSHIVKRRGNLQAEQTGSLAANSETRIELLEARPPYALYRLTPRTGKTHQLRVHLNALGIPIVGDPLYPDVLDVDPGDFTQPLQLVARSLAFTDPIDLRPRRFISSAVLTWPAPHP